MKDRIRQIMESQHMTQQVFADFIGTTPATLSGIFNDRTRPTINIVESIKKKIPDISLEWLMFGQGAMYKEGHQQAPDLFGPQPTAADDSQQPSSSPSVPPLSLSPGQQTARTTHEPTLNLEGVKATLTNVVREELKILDKPKRHVSEIRIYYDDGSYESFLPARH